MNPIAKYLFALSAMIVAYTAYAKLAIPFLEGPPGVVSRRQPNLEYPEASQTLDKSHLPSIVPENAWELGSCKTLLTSQGTVYFEYWETVDDQGTYKLMPFTIVINDPVNSIRDGSVEPDTKPKPAPIVLRSLEGARLKFSKPLTARSKKEDIDLQSAQLDGQVTVFRPSNPAKEEDEIKIITRNVQINRNRIFTLSDVDFSVGPHHGRGRNLNIELAHDQNADSPTRSFSSINGVEQMELAFVSELVLQPADANTFLPDRKQEASKEKTDRTLSLSNQETPLKLSCDGPFVFRMTENRAWFRENVRLTQLDRFRDNLGCDSLQIELGREPNSDSTSIRKLIALGTPEKPATIVSNSQQTLITGEELEYDVALSMVKARGLNPVSIRSPKFAFEAPNLEYRLAENKKLGALVSAGPGILKGIDEELDQPFEVRWGGKLTTKDFDSQRVEIAIEEGAIVKFDGNQEIASDQLKFVVWQLPDRQSEKSKWTYEPSRLETRGNVRIATEKLNGTANELIANWAEPSTGIGTTLNHSVSYRPTRVWQRDDRFRPLPSSESALRFNGDKIVANVEGSMNKLSIVDLKVEGALALKSDPNDPRAFAVTGQSMKLFPQADDLYRVTIEGVDGDPATFKSKGINIAGGNLQLDQSANTIWVQGEGTLDIDGSASVEDRKKLPTLDDAKVEWLGGMVFDGSRIYFEHDVELVANQRPDENGQQSTIRANSETLTIELTETVKLTDSGTIGDQSSQDTKPEIHRMVFANQIEPQKRAFRLASNRKSVQQSANAVSFLNATVDARGNLVSAQQLLVPMATVDAISGNVVTSGPGQALTYQYSSGKGGLSGFSRRQTDTESNKRKLACTHTRFDGQLVANSREGTMRIDRNTRSAWANVDRFDQTLDPDRPDRLPVGAAVLKSDVLKFDRWTPRNSNRRQEMLAEGNTSIQSDLFEAVADRMTYNDDTDILVIEGKPPADARLSYRRNPKARPETLIANKVMYRLSDQWTSVSDIRSVEGELPAKKK